MGRQVNFFLHPDDQEDFDQLLRSFGEVVFLPYYHYNNIVSTIGDTLIRSPDEADRVYLVRTEDMGDVKLHHIPKYDYWLVDDDSLCILEFDRCIAGDDKIERGRLYFKPNYRSNGQWIKKPDDFIKWADRIVRAARKRLKKHEVKMGDYTLTEYFGAKAIEWAEQYHAVAEPGGQRLVATT